MNKSEFIKLEKKHGLDLAVEQLMIEFEKNDDDENCRAFWTTEEILDNLHEAITEWDFEYAYAVLETLIDNKKFAESKHDYWKEADGKYLFEPIKSIKDIEEFLDDEGGAENEI